MQNGEYVNTTKIEYEGHGDGWYFDVTLDFRNERKAYKIIHT